MFDEKEFFNNVALKMDAAISFFKKELLGLRTGRASVHFLDPVMVDAYGTKMPISQVSSVSTPDPRMISIQVWDKAMVKSVEKSLSDANLGISPSVDGQTIRLNMPTLTENRRKELVKLAYKYDENCKITLRNIRRAAVETIKSEEKLKQISEDEMHNILDKLQKMTDRYVLDTSNITKSKDKEIMQI